MEKTFNFIISDKGIPVFQSKEFNNWLQENAMKRGYMTVVLYDPRDRRNIGGYYKKVIISKLKQAYQELEQRYYSEADVEHRIWEELGLYDRFDMDEPDIYKLEVHDAWLVCEEIKKYASFNLKYYIE